jgi:dTDP-4-dehydrorhamnose reductase
MDPTIDVVILGSGGQLGWELVRQGRGRGLKISFMDFPEIDISDASSVREALSPLKAGLIVNAAAYTAVERAEEEPEAAFAANREGPANIAAVCREKDIPLVHFSTDFVFNGEKKGAYREDDPVAPLSAYGRSKAAGETALREMLPRHLILRTAWLYGVHGPNFVKTILKLARERKVIRVVADQHGCPTYAADLAGAVIEVAGRFLGGGRVIWGTYHYGGGGSATWHGLAEAVVEIAGRYETFQVKKVEPITTAEYPMAARRPANSVLDCSRIAERFGIRPRPWRESLAEMIERLYTREES